MNTMIKKGLAVACVLLLGLSSVHAQSWQWANPALNGSITVKSVDGLSSSSVTQNPTGAVAKTNQTAVTAAPLMVVQATAQLPVVTEGAACAVPADQYGTKADLSMIYGCRLGVWTKMDIVPTVVEGAACGTTDKVGVTAGNTKILSCQSGVWISTGSGLGYGQSYQDVTGIRSLGATYANATGNPILVNLTGWTSGGTHAYYLIANGAFAGAGVMSFNSVGGNYYGGTTFIVPASSTYQIQCYQCAGSGGITNWVELR